MTTEQATVAAKPEWLGKAGNALRCHFSPAPVRIADQLSAGLKVARCARGVAFWRTTAGVSAFGKAASLAGKPKLDGSPPQNAMTMLRV